jgi:hypothetical protein
MGLLFVQKITIESEQNPQQAGQAMRVHLLHMNERLER